MFDPKIVQTYGARRCHDGDREVEMADFHPGDPGSIPPRELET